MTGYIRPDNHFKIILFVVILTVFLGNGLTLFVPEMACAQFYQSYSMPPIDTFYTDWLGSSNNQWWSMPYGQSTLYFQTPNIWGSYSGWMQQPSFSSLGNGYPGWKGLEISPVSSLPFFNVNQNYSWVIYYGGDGGCSSGSIAIPYSIPLSFSDRGYWYIVTDGDEITGMGWRLAPGETGYHDWVKRQLHPQEYFDPGMGIF